MSLRNQLLALTMCGATALVGCGDDDVGAADSELCTRLGGQAGVETAVGGFVGRVLADPKINGYFLNADVLVAESEGEPPRLVRCLNEQIGEAVGCGGVTYTCSDMTSVHATLNISTNDFNDLVTNLTDELEELNVDEADIDTITGVLAPMAEQIVTDEESNGTIYQRLGRRPTIEAVIDAFVGRVVENPEINSFFGGLDTAGVERLKICLVRQVCGAAGGPCVYTEEAGDDLRSDMPCRMMVPVHEGLEEETPGGAPDTAGIDIADFEALVNDLVQSVPEPVRSSEDAAALVGVVNSLCPQIVIEDDRDMCPQ